MYTDEDIQSAVQAGIFTPESADRFRDYVAARQNLPIADEEHFRLVTGFNDIFVVIACSLLLGSIWWIGNSFMNGLGGLGVAAAAWGLAEFFVKKRRMALPAIVLLLFFIGGSYFAVNNFLVPMAYSSTLGCIAAAVAAWFHWRHFQVPITIAAGTAAAVGSLIALAISTWPDALVFFRAICFFSGLAVFCFAMWWDSADTARRTRKSDVAFWLHLVASPLIVHSVFTSIHIFEGKLSTLSIGIIVVLYILIACVSLLIDRRAMMVSSLFYVIYAISALFEKVGVIKMDFAITALFIGGMLLLLSAYWHKARSLLVRFMPHNITARLPALR